MSQQPHEAKGCEDRSLLPDVGFPRWIVSIDELPGQDWLFEIDSPAVYLTVQITDLSVLDRVIDFLNSALGQHEASHGEAVVSHCNDMVLGRFGEAMVHLLRDNEDFPRCFIVVEPTSELALRISLDADDIQAFATALTRALGDQPKNPETIRLVFEP